MEPTAVFLPWKTHGQRDPADYSLWGGKGAAHSLETKQQQGSSLKRQQDVVS